jgi:hypothetical protein
MVDCTLFLVKIFLKPSKVRKSCKGSSYITLKVLSTFSLEIIYSTITTYQIWLTGTSILTNGNFALCGQRVFRFSMCCRQSRSFLLRDCSRSNILPQFKWNHSQWACDLILVIRAIAIGVLNGCREELRLVSWAFLAWWFSFLNVVCQCIVSLRNADRVSLPRDATQSANPRALYFSDVMLSYISDQWNSSF